MAGDFAPIEQKMRAAQLPDVAIRSFRAAYAELAKGATGLLSRREIAPVENVPGTEALHGVRAAGEAALARTVVIKLNGGLGTSMGMTQAKSLLRVKQGLSFLDITARQIGWLRERTGCAVPLVLMNSFRTRADSLAALARYGSLSAPLAPDFLQHKVPRIRVDDLRPVEWPSEPSHEWCPPGHGDLYAALVSSGVLAALLAAGTRYAFVSNADNLGAALDLDLLGWFAESGAPFAMEVKERSEADRKGGHLCRLANGRLALREIAQCPEDEQQSFQDISLYKFFNTNNLWIDLVALEKTLAATGGVLALPLIRNEKSVDPDDPRSARVYQLETAMGAAIAVFEGAVAIRVPSERFAPVKTTGDLLAVRSDAFVLTDDYCIAPAPGRSGALVVDLDAETFRRVQDLEARTPHGEPSLVHCRRLVVRGDVVFGRDVVIEGEVRIEARDGERRILGDGQHLRG